MLHEKKKRGGGGDTNYLSFAIVLSLWPRLPQLICEAMAPAKGAFTPSQEPGKEAPLNPERCEWLGWRHTPAQPHASPGSLSHCPRCVTWRLPGLGRSPELAIWLPLPFSLPPLLRALGEVVSASCPFVDSYWIAIGCSSGISIQSISVKLSTDFHGFWGIAVSRINPYPIEQ